MKFTTPISIPKTTKPIDYQSKLVFLGSCFAENIGDKFEYFKFQNTVNPFGIIFNPASIKKIVSRIVNQQLFTENDIFFYNESWHCHEIHSELSNSNKKVFLSILNELIISTKEQFRQASHCFITLGTSWVYRHIETNQIVANCHKVPQKQFTKELLSIEEIEKCLVQIKNEVHSINPNCHFIFTVSPVRHIKDGFVENQRSKAHLITAIHQILQSEIYNLKSAIYFHSYEIMIDELRDYRFYAEDMLHPNQTAIDYIWQRLTETYIDQNCYLTMNEVETIQKGLAHRPFNINSESHQQFLSKLKDKIDSLQKQFPHIQF